jgi:hypothetical protein
MALQEAWARNVPTFVWNKGYVICNDIKFYGKISAPYLTEKTGAFFKDFTEFKDKLPRFIDSLENFRPAEYCKENLSIERSAKIYTDIIENKTKPWINK